MKLFELAKAPLEHGKCYTCLYNNPFLEWDFHAACLVVKVPYERLENSVKRSISSNQR